MEIIYKWMESVKKWPFIISIDLITLFLVGFVIATFARPLNSWITHIGSLITSSGPAVDSPGLFSFLFSIRGVPFAFAMVGGTVLTTGLFVYVVWTYLQQLSWEKLVGKQLKSFPLITLRWALAYGVLDLLSLATMWLNRVSMQVQPELQVFDWRIVWIPLKLIVVWCWVVHLSMKATEGKWKWKKQAIALVSAAGVFLLIHLILLYLNHILIIDVVGGWKFLIWFFVGVCLFFPAWILVRLIAMEASR